MKILYLQVVLVDVVLYRRQTASQNSAFDNENSISLISNTVSQLELPCAWEISFNLLYLLGICSCSEVKILRVLSLRFFLIEDFQLLMFSSDTV